MAEIKLPNLIQRGGKWVLHYKHPMIRRPNGVLKLVRIATNLDIAQIGEARKWSDATQQFKNDPKWHRISMFGQARLVHEQSANAFYLPLKPQDDSGLKSDGTTVIWPVTKEEGHWDEELIEIEQALKRSRETEGENATLKFTVAEKDAELQTLRKELGIALSGKDQDFAPLADQYVEWGKLKGGKGGTPWSFHHTRKRVEHLEFWKERISKLSDLKFNDIEVTQNDLAEDKAGKTVNSYTDCLSAFCEWAIVRKHFISNPLKGLTKLDETPLTNRRSLSPDEIDALLAKCESSRRIVYEGALVSGLRRNELLSIRVANLDAVRGGLVLSKTWTKNRKEGFQPLPAWFVKKLAASVLGHDSTGPLFPTMPLDPYRPFEKDLAAAGITKDVVGVGKIDFHALRVSYLTLVDGQLASPKSAQSLARHSTPDITFRRYVKAVDSELVRITEGVGQVVAGA